MIPVEILIENEAHVATDNAWQMRARLLQSLWRQRMGLPAGLHRGRPLGSRLTLEVGEPPRLAGYMTGAAREEVQAAVAEAPTTGALLSRPRLWVDLLSSQPLCFNFFADMAADTTLATSVLSQLWPDIVQVDRIRFEYSPGRGDTSLTGNRSAFDVFVEYQRVEGPAFLGIEVKYHENMRVSAAKDLTSRYPEIARSTHVFRDEALGELALPPLQQLWLDHLLVLRLKETKPHWTAGTFVLLAPLANTACAKAANRYRTHLADAITFEYRTLEDVVSALRDSVASSLAAELHSRYLDPAVLTSAGVPPLAT